MASQSKRDQIVSSLASGGYTVGSVVDRERLRLRTALALTVQQAAKLSLRDLYRSNGETPRIR